MTQDTDPTPRLNPDDFEAGEDVTDEVAVSPTPGIQLAVRLSLEEATQLQAIARKEGKSLTEVARASLLARKGSTGSVPHGAPAAIQARKTAFSAAERGFFGGISSSRMRCQR